MRSLIKTKLLVNYLSVCELRHGFNRCLRRLSMQSNKTTVSEEEVNKFRSYKDMDWRTHRLFAPLVRMNELRVPFIRDTYSSSPVNTSKPLSGIRLLEIGCGAGLLSEPLARLGAHVTGIDPTGDNIEMAANHAMADKTLADNLRYECVSVEDFAKREQSIESFDGVIASEVIEHIDDIELFLTSGISCLKRGGNLFITTINQTPVALFAAVFVAEYVLRLVPKGVHQYNRFVSPDALSLVLEDLVMPFNGCNNRAVLQKNRFKQFREICH